jgi:three-Cys-motif partner protein
VSKKSYQWETGAKLEEHTARKLKILREYFSDYLRIRCNYPQRRFRLAIVDGFSGGGRYSNGKPGSPIVFVEVIRQLSEQLNIERAAQALPELQIDCRLFLNDADPVATKLLRENLAPLLAEAKENARHLELQAEFSNAPFAEIYPDIKDRLLKERYKNVLFNLDQCGDAMVTSRSLRDILSSFSAGEVFLTFMIKSLLTYLQKDNPNGLQKRLDHLEISVNNMSQLDRIMTKSEWLGTAERIVFDSFKNISPFVSPFSLTNPNGWRYWLMHFTNSVRARQAYNDVLHRNSNHQAHFGRSGLNMFSFNPAREGHLCLFQTQDRQRAQQELADDIPRLISEFGDALSVDEFYRSAYNLTPAHSDDIKRAMILGEEVEVLTPEGNPRRKSATISLDDTLRLKPQRSFYFTGT